MTSHIDNLFITKQGMIFCINFLTYVTKQFFKIAFVLAGDEPKKNAFSDNLLITESNLTFTGNDVCLRFYGI